MERFTRTQLKQITEDDRRRQKVFRENDVAIGIAPVIKENRRHDTGHDVDRNEAGLHAHEGRPD